MLAKGSRLSNPTRTGGSGNCVAMAEFWEDHGEAVLFILLAYGVCFAAAGICWFVSQVCFYFFVPGFHTVFGLSH